MNSKLLIWILILILFGAIVAAIVIPQFTDAAQDSASAERSTAIVDSYVHEQSGASDY